MLDTADETIKRSILTDGNTRRRDSPLHNLFPELDGFIETGGPVHRDEEVADSPLWFVSPPSASAGSDSDPIRRRDSLLHNLPDDGIIEHEGPEPHIGDSHAWFVNICASRSELLLMYLRIRNAWRCR